jgi:hypothetical protein
MRQQVRILAIGASALLEGIAICLEQDPSFILQKVQSDRGDALNLISQFEPDAIVYQLDCPEFEQIMLLIPALPEIRLVGLDAKSNKVLVIDSGLVENYSFAEFRQLLLELRIANAGVNFADQTVK